MNMAKLSKIAGVLFLFSTLARAATPTTLDASLQATMDKYRTKYSMPGLAVSVKLPGDAAIHDYFSGTSSKRASGAPIDKESLFQIGGVTKSFTAALVLQLEAEGKLSLDDALGKWLPQFSDWKAITLRQLLNETSGVFNYLTIPRFVSELANDSSQGDLVLADLVDMAYRNKPNMSFKTGQKWEPSSTNYALLGLVIEAVTTHSVNDEMNQRLLGSHFGLTNTFYFPYPAAAVTRLTHGYETDGATDVSHFNMSGGGPAGGLISNAHDIALWSEALFTGSVLQPKQLTEMMSLVSMKNAQPLKEGVYSMGVGFGVQAGVESFTSKYGIVYEYSGVTRGYRAQYLYLPCYDLIVAVTINNVSTNPKDMTDMVGDLLKTLTTSTEWLEYKKAHQSDAVPAACKKIRS